MPPTVTGRGILVKGKSLYNLNVRRESLNTLFMHSLV